ncbi:unnamed protein product [Rotaria sp. Silwood1]|nr:unnamed protein product [Rotaria sp. Silwood1]
MYVFNFYCHFLWFNILAYSIPAIHLFHGNHATVNDVNKELHTPLRSRHRRGSFTLFNPFSEVNAPEYIARDQGTFIMSDTNARRHLSTGSWLGLVKNQTGRVIEGATDLVLTPVHWLAHMREYW